MEPHRARTLETFREALLHLLVLAALPIALWKLTGNPIPRSLPTWLDVQLWWSSVQAYPQQTLDILPRILVDALWIAWAWHAAWFTLTALWMLLHLPGIALPRILLRLTPRTATHALTVGAVAAVPATHAAPTVHALQHRELLPASFDGRLHLTAPVRATPRPHPLIISAHQSTDGTLTHRVVEHDTLWDLATRYYGDGEQGHRIYAANAGHLQPDGGRLSDPDLIQPGWNLAIPIPGMPASSPSTASAAPLPAANPNSAPHHASSSPDPANTLAPGRPGAAPTAEAAHPSASPPVNPAAPRTPHTVGWHIPGGGYVGITLLAAIAAAVALLRTRHRRHPGSPPPPIPARIAQLAAVHGEAVAADALGYEPQEHPAGPPPPLLALNPAHGAAVLGTAANQLHEVTLDSINTSTILCYTGPGAKDAVRAMIISTLAASPANGSGTTAVLIDRHLADDLFAAGTDDSAPGWLHLADTPHDAVAQFDKAARRLANDEPLDTVGIGTPDPHLMLVLCADEDLTELYDTVANVCALSPAATTAVVLGQPAHAQSFTTITLDQDGAVQHVSGTHQTDLERMTVHTLTLDLAADIYRVLRAARAPYAPSIPHATGVSQYSGSAAASTQSPLKAIEVSAPSSAPVPATQTNTDGATAVGKERGSTLASPSASTDLLADIRTPLLLRLIGPIDVVGPQGTAAPNGEKLHMLLALLALHPQGYTAQQLADAGWPEITDEELRRRAAYTTISRTRTPFHTANGTDPHEPGRYIIKDHGTFRLDADQITTDLALLDRLLREAEYAADPAERRTLLCKAAALHRGTLARGVSDQNRDWLADARYDLQERIVRIHLDLADLCATDDPDSAVTHLDAATDLAGDDEDITAQAIRAYRRLGRPDLAHTAHQRLIAALDDLGEQPSTEILQLADA